MNVSSALLPAGWIVATGIASMAGLPLQPTARRWVAFGCATLALIGLMTVVAGGHPFGYHLNVSRLNAGLSILGALAVAIALLTGAPPRPLGLLSIGLIGACMAIALEQSSPFYVGVWITGALVILAGRWFIVRSSEEMMRSMRMLGFAGLLLVGIAMFLPLTNGVSPLKSAYVAWLYATVCLVLFGLIPFQGWVISAIRRLDPIELVGWYAVILPGTIIVMERTFLTLPLMTQATFETALTDFGFLTVIVGAVLLIRANMDEQYLRLLLIDCGCVAVGFGSGTVQGWIGALTLVSMHALVAPLLLQSRGQPQRVVERAAWWAIGGLPLSVGFWGRLLVLIAASQDAWIAAVGVVVVAVVVVGQTTGSIFRKPHELQIWAWTVTESLQWGAAIILIAAGIAPATFLWLLYEGAPLLPPGVH